MFEIKSEQEQHVCQYCIHTQQKQRQQEPAPKPELQLPRIKRKERQLPWQKGGEGERRDWMQLQLHRVLKNSLDAVAWSCQLSPQEWPQSQKPVMARGSSADKGRLQILPAQDRKFAVPQAHRAVHSLYPDISTSANNFSWRKWVIHNCILFQEKKRSHTLNTLTQLQLTLLNNKI